MNFVYLIFALAYVALVGLFAFLSFRLTNARLKRIQPPAAPTKPAAERPSCDAMEVGEHWICNECCLIWHNDEPRPACRRNLTGRFKP